MYPTNVPGFAAQNQAQASFMRGMKKERSEKIWETRNAIAAEIRPAADKLDDLDIEETVLTRMANRRKTDAQNTHGKNNNDFFSHSGFGKPEVGVRMVSVQTKAEDNEEYISPAN